MKESTLILLKEQVNKNTVLQQEMLKELFHLRELCVGTMELVKKLDGYDDALEKLKEEIKLPDVEDRLGDGGLNMADHKTKE